MAGQVVVGEDLLPGDIVTEEISAGDADSGEFGTSGIR